MVRKKKTGDPGKISGVGEEFEICGKTWTFRPLNVQDSMKSRAFWQSKVREWEAGELKKRIEEETVLLDASGLSPRDRMDALRGVRDEYKAEIKEGLEIIGNEEAPKSDRQKALVARIAPVLNDLDNCVEAYERLLFLGARKDHPDLTMDIVKSWDLTIPTVGPISDALSYILPEGDKKEGEGILSLLGLDPDGAPVADDESGEKKTSVGASPTKKSKCSSDTGPTPASS